MSPSPSDGDAPLQPSRPGLPRRAMLAGVGLATVGAAIAGLTWRQRREKSGEHHGLSPENPRTAEEALARLRAGNECYISEHFQVGDRGRTGARRTEVAPAQHPYAVVLACADSRVAPEIVFSAGLGDLFVVRVAGNIVDARCLGVLGSIEYAIEELKIPLVFVLGHEGCGAVKAAIQAVQQEKHPPGAIAVLTDAIRPVVEMANRRPGDLIHNAVLANVEMSIERLLSSEEIVAPAIASRRVQVTGGVYELETGRVRLSSNWE